MLLNPALRPPTERAQALRWAAPWHSCAASRRARLTFLFVLLIALAVGNLAWAHATDSPLAGPTSAPPTTNPTSALTDSPTTTPVASAEVPARAGIQFALDVNAPAPLQALLQRHLALQRFHELPDLDAGELSRLVHQLPADATGLLGTQGLLSPRITTHLHPPQVPNGPWRVQVDVVPGPISHIGQVVLALVNNTDTASTNPTASASASASASAETEDKPPHPGPVAQARALAEQRLRQQWPLTTGQAFSQSAWDVAKAQALRSLSTESFLNARLTNSLADVDTDTHTVNLAVELDTGPAFTLGPVRIDGLERYEPEWMDNLVRAAGVAPGQPYRLHDLQAAQQRLAQSGYFDSVFVYVDPDADPNAAPVQVQVREARRGRLRLGVGISTDSGPRLSAEHTWNRVPGLNWRAHTQLKLEKDNPNLLLDLRSPTDDKGWQWNTRLLAERVRAGDTHTTNQQLRVGKLHENELINRHVYAQYDRSLVNSPVLRLAGPLQANEALSGTYAWSRNRLVGMPSPTQGHALAVEVGLGTTLGSVRKPFARTRVRWQGLLPLNQDWALASLWPNWAPGQPQPTTAAPGAAALGAAPPLDPTSTRSGGTGINNSARPARQLGRLALRLEAGAVAAAAQAPLPDSQLFWAGGDQSVRGYSLRDLGVAQADGSLRPGRVLSAGSVEWQRPVLIDGEVSPWESTVFMDAGAVANHAADLRARVGVGAGVRFNSPAGPLQLDLAYGLTPKRWRVHFSVGMTF